MPDRIVEVIACIVLLASMSAASFTSRSIASQRQELDLVVSMAGTRGMPPNVALTTAALGTFRGLAVDFLWARADALQDSGQFFEAQTISQWITALQPRFPKVWAFQAWNLAYNISVTTALPEERWGWITRGVELLRSRGIPLNPKDARLPSELSWIFFHKIGGKLDREHWYYKARLAREFREALGDTTGGRSTEDALERFRKIVDAADSLNELNNDPAVEAAIAVLSNHGEQPDEKLLRMLGRVILYTGSIDAKIREGNVLPSGTNRELLGSLLENPAEASTIFEVIVPHLQKRLLIDRYHMDPGFMLEQMERYGPLDWAHPNAHGIYWSELALSLSQEMLRREDVNELMAIRTRLITLRQLMRTGRIEFDPLADRIDILPDPRFIDGYERGMQEAVRLMNSAGGVSAGEFGRAEMADLLDGYESFLHEATVFSFLYGDEAQATGCFAKAKKIAEGSGRGNQPLYSEGLEGFLALRLSSVMDIDVSNTRQFLDAMVQRAMLDGLAKGRLDTFNRFVKIAFDIYDRRYGESSLSNATVNKEARLPPFPELVDASFESAMKQEANPVLVRARIWAWAPDSLRERTWPALSTTLSSHADAAGLDPSRAFPAPQNAESDSKEAILEPAETAF
ncbi:MAG: hypothetical protein ISQ07_06865 [Pirellulales bacterium]|jgi:hypothetical protein|nr:hypothetical protein [Pirellulales bacterium]